MHNYLSDISREEFEIIRKDLESTRKTTKPRKIHTSLQMLIIAFVAVLLKRF